MQSTVKGESQSNDPQYPPLTVGYELGSDPSYQITIKGDIWKSAAKNINIGFSGPSDSFKDDLTMNNIRLTGIFDSFTDNPNSSGSGGNSKKESSGP
jgi:hypothetical protein